jgi:hypothetical protein
MRIITSKVVTASILAIVLLGIATAPAAAHHSFAMYDTSIEKTMTGKLIRFVIGANHSQYVFQVLNPDGSLAVDSKGEPVIWNVETGPAAQLARNGITVESFKIGTIFTVTFSPLRDGRNGGAQRREALIMCGMKLPEGGCTEKTGKKF